MPIRPRKMFVFDRYQVQKLVTLQTSLKNSLVGYSLAEISSSSPGLHFEAAQVAQASQFFL